MKELLRKIFFIFSLIITSCFISSETFAQRFAVASGNWNGAIWATTPAGVPGSAATPTATDAVTVNPGVSVNMNVNGGCASLTLSCGAVSGSTISGAALLTLSGDITVNSAGTGVSGALISSRLALGADRIFTINDDGTAATDLTISGVVSGLTFGFTKLGAGTIVLSGVNTYRGTTNISTGTLKISGGTNISNTSAVIVDGVFDLNGASESVGSLAGTGTVTSSVAGNIVLSAGGDNSSTSFSGIIQNGSATSLGFTKGGAGTLTLSGNNSYTGVTTISAGIVQLGSAGDGTNTPLGTIAGATSVTAGAMLDLNGFTLSTDEALILNGSGITNGGALSNNSATAVAYTGLITLGSASRIVADAGDINITGTSDITGNTFRLTLAGTGNGSITRNLNNTTGGLTKTGTGTWTVSGNSSYTASTIISGGIFKLGSAGDGTNTPLGTIAGRTTVSAGAVLDLNGITISTLEPLTINGTGISNGGVLVNSAVANVDYNAVVLLGSASSIIADAGAINLLNTGTMTGTGFGLTLGGSGNGTIASIIGTGAGTLTKIGTGTWTLSGVNTYTGATTISTGTIKIGGGTNIANTNAVTVDGVLDLAGANESIGSLAGTGTVTSSVAGTIVLTVGGNNTSTTFSGILENGSATSVGLTKIGTATFTVSGNNTYTGLTTVTAGRLQLGAAGDGTNTALGTIDAGTTVSAGATLDLNGFTLSTDESLILNGTGITLGGALSNSSATAVDYTGLITLGSASRIAADAGDINITGTSVITGNTFRLTLAGAGNGSITRDLNNTTGGLTKTGTGIWTVSGNSTYTASTIVSGGVLKLGSEGDGTGTPLGTIAGRTTVNAGGTLDLNGFTISTNEPLTINGIGAAGDGALINSDPAAVNYNTTVTLGSASTIGTTGNISISSFTVLTGGQNLTKVGTGTLNLTTGTCTIGSLLISAGALTATSGILNVSGDFTNDAAFNNNNGIVNFNGASAQQITGSVATTFYRLTLSNAAGLSLNAVNATVSNILTLTSGSLSIASNTLTLNGTVTGAGTFTGSTASNLTIGGTGAFGTLLFNQTTNPVTNGLANLVINRGGAGSVTLGSTLNVLTAATFTAGVLNSGANILRLGGSVSRTSGTITTSGAGVVTFNGTSAQSIPSGLFTSNTATNITISNAAGVTFNGSMAVTGNFQVNANSLFIPAPAVIISGAGTLLGNNANNSIAQVTRATGTADLAGQYTLNRNLTNLVIEYAGASAQGIAATTTFGGLKISNTSGVNMAGAATVSTSLNLNSGNLVINGNTLTVNGAVSRTSGNLAGSNQSNLVIGGTAGSLYFDGTGTNNYLKNFTINTGASATLGNTLNITGGASASNEGTLTVSGTGVLTTGGFLVIKSNVNGTARIAPGNTSGGYISGDVTVERYIPQNASKAWRLLASNTSGQTINAAWQEGQVGPLSNTNPGFGTMISAPFANLALAQAAGYDTLSPSSSIRKYDPSTDALVNVPNTNATGLSSEQGYFIFIRGDRSANQFGANNVPTTSTTLRSKGSVFQGDQSTVTVPVAPFGYGLLRNPYASAIDLRNVTIGGGLVDAYQVWDPKLAGSSGVGAFQTLTRSGANYVVTPGGGNYPASGSVFNTIESGEAFYVQATGSDGSVQINESSKTSGSNLVFRPASGTLSEDSRIITNLYAIVNSKAVLADGNMILFDAANNNGFDKNDVKKSSNFGDNLGIMSNNNLLVVERRALPTSNETILYNIGSLKRISYRLEIQPSNIDPLQTVFLEDKFLNTLTPVSLAAPTTYDFTVTTTAASAAKDRFGLVFRPAGALPVTFSSIKAAQVSNDVAVEWKVTNQVNIAGYEVEKSTDGSRFIKVGSQAASQFNGMDITYNWLDGNAAAGVNYYRIKAIELSGNIKYTEIVKVTLGKLGTGIAVSPNPVRGSLLNIQLNNQKAGKYGVRLINTAGQEVYKSVLQHAGGSASQSINLPSAVTRGIYQLQVIAPDNSLKTQKLIVDKND